MMFVTVLGDTQEIADGVVDAHAHVWIDPLKQVSGEGVFVLNDENGITRELQAFRAAGGAAVIDCQPPHTGRNLQRLAQLARTSGITIIAATGFHLPRYYRPGTGPWAEGQRAARTLFEHELTTGITHADGERRIRAGLIKTAHPGELNSTFMLLLRAALEVSERTGAALLVHTERGQGVEALADFIEREGGDTRRIVLCHMDKRADAGVHQELADRGFLLEYDTFYRPKYEPERTVWPLVEQMLTAGYEHAIAFGLDLADPLMWRFRGASGGLEGLPTELEERLAKFGTPPAARRALLRENILGRVNNPRIANSQPAQARDQ